MSLRATVKKEGEYPLTNTNYKRELLEIEDKVIVLTTYETLKSINIYLGGVKHWCIHCELIKDNGKIKEDAYLIKIRYDMLCSLEKNIKRGGDMIILLKLLIQYIYNTYPSVKYLLFNDLSSRSCDNGYNTNLAVMTYLYSGQTWYEKNFNAFIAPQNEQMLKQILIRYNESKSLQWDEIKDTINNYNTLPYTENELETLYITSKTWKEFFETIKNKIGIAQFCIFVSSWLEKFILKYFNNLMGLNYKMPITQTDIKYKQKEFKGGRYKSFFRGARKNKTIKRYSEIE